MGSSSNYIPAPAGYQPPTQAPTNLPRIFRNGNGGGRWGSVVNKMNEMNFKKQEELRMQAYQPMGIQMTSLDGISQNATTTQQTQPIAPFNPFFGSYLNY